MEWSTFTAGIDDNGRRFDRILKRLLPHAALSELYQNLRKGFVKLNGKKADGSTRVSTNDIISVASFLVAPENTEEPQQMYCTSLETVFRNEYIWVINKPYGIPVQPSEGTGENHASLSEIVATEYKASRNGSDSLSFIPGPLHRLDRNTTGLLAFSQNLLGAQWFTKALSSESPNGRLIQKTYIGIAQGHLQTTAVWEDTITESNNTDPHSFHTVNVGDAHTPISSTTPSSTIPYDSRDLLAAKYSTAITKAIPLAYGSCINKPLTLVQFDILTGRKHQIRAQSSRHGFPLFGDIAYSGSVIPPSLHADRAFYLHAIRLSFQDNPIGLPNELIAPLSKDFTNFLSQTLINWNGSLILK
jgi:23S rRNA pseudouridine955/2504/2580 synthase